MGLCVLVKVDFKWILIGEAGDGEYVSQLWIKDVWESIKVTNNKIL